MRCDWCGKAGHVEEKCFRKRQGKPKSAEGKAEVVALTLVTQEIISEPREWDFEEHSRALLAHIGVTKKGCHGGLTLGASIISRAIGAFCTTTVLRPQTALSL